MIGRLIQAGAITLAAMMLAACNGGNQPTTPERTQPTEERAVTAVPTKIMVQEPTKVQRLDYLLPTATAGREAQASGGKEAGPKKENKETGGPETGRKPESREEATKEETPKATPERDMDEIADLVPEDPQTNDQVLLQDIYEKMDLEQFALDPDEPVPFPYEQWKIDENTTPVASYAESVEIRHQPGPSRVDIYNLRSNLVIWIQPLLTSRMEHPLVHEHPYRHLFPELKYVASEKGEDFEYRPFAGSDDTWGHSEKFSRRENYFDISVFQNGLVHFIYNPWFELVTGDWHTRVPSWEGQGVNLGMQDGDPYWFGDNSTRGVLAETVAGLLEEARLPTAEPFPRKWWVKKAIENHPAYLDSRTIEPREWTMEEYIRVSTSHKSEPAEATDYHNMPRVTWEILHPKLPIVRVNVHAAQALPLGYTEEPSLPAPMTEIPEEERLCFTTIFSG